MTWYLHCSFLTLSSSWILEWKKMQLSQEYLNHHYETKFTFSEEWVKDLSQNSHISRLCISRTFGNNWFTSFPGTSSQAFPAFLYLSKTFPAFPESPSLSIPSYPIFPSSTYKNFNIFKNLKVGNLGIPGNSHLTQLFSQLLM